MNASYKKNLNQPDISKKGKFKVSMLFIINW